MTTTDTQPAQISWPTFRAAVMEWRDQQPNPRAAETAAFSILHAARDFWGDAAQVMRVQAHVAQNIGKYAELSAKTAVRALQYHMERDYFTAQGDTERAAEFARRLTYWEGA